MAGKAQIAPQAGWDASFERRIVERAQGGDEEAFRMLYEHFAPAVARRLLRLIGSKHEAEDVLQATFLEAHRSLPRCAADRPFGAWLNGISMHMVSRHLRSRWRWRWLRLTADPVENPTAGDDGPDEHAIRHQLSRLVQREMSRLPPDQRIALALHELEGLGCSEIAREVGESPQTVWARVQTARRRLREALERSVGAAATPTEERP